MGLDQIGQKLKAAREGQGLSLSQIYERTKIPTNHLQSIDEGWSDDLPEPVYVAGFIKRYADCVGLNGQSLSDEYRRQNSNGSGSNGDAGWGAKLISQPMLTAQPYTGRSGIDVRPPNVFKQGLFYAVLIVVVLFCFSFLFAWQSNYQLNLQSDQANQLLKRDYRGALSGVQPPASTTTTTQAPTEAQAPGAATPETQPPAETEASIALNASKHVWLNVTAVSTGQSLYEGYMESGERKDFKDAQGVRVRAGNGASVSVEFQGKSETLGAAGKVAEKAFMSKSPAAQAAIPDAKAQAAAQAALKAASVKKAVKPKLASDAAAHKHAKSADESGSANSAARAPIDVPYRYTESPND